MNKNISDEKTLRTIESLVTPNGQMAFKTKVLSERNKK